MALILIANNNVELPPEEVERLRNQVFSNLIDEKLQIQEAKAAEITIDENVVNEQFARLATRFKQTPEQFSQYRSEEHTSELQSLMRISYAVFCLKKKKINTTTIKTINNHSDRN